ncbi:MAG: hypothetical protein IKP61_02105 [Spirochaetales bacterium]|nr:hypothetical protein [Spirochaetales bacterium]
MSELSFSSYVETIRPFLMKHAAKEDAAMFLLDSVSKQIPAGEDKKKKDITKDGTLKKILRGVAQAPEDIRLATAKPEVVEGVVKYFREDVTQDLNPNLRDETVEAFRIYVKADFTLPDTRKAKLLALLEEGDFAIFLAETFIYVINRPCSMNVEDGHQKISIPLLIFTLLYGLTIYISTLVTIVVTGEFSQALMAFAFFFSIGLFLFLIGFYFFLWRRDI